MASNSYWWRSRCRWGCWAADPSSLPQKAQRVSDMVDAAIESSRSLSYEVHCPSLYSEGLAAALHSLVPQKQEQCGLTLHVDADDQAEPASEDVRVVLFELIRELLVNVVKYAGTDEAWSRAVHEIREGLQRLVAGDEPLHKQRSA